MFIESLSVKHLRNISEVKIEPGPGINLLTGPNASGKTALLEAIHMLARARSFRSPRIREIIQEKQNSLQVSARLKNFQGETIATGIEKAYGATTIRFQGKTLNTVSEQARNIPVVVNTPDSQILVTGSPKDRRHWLDWAMFHVEPAYLETWHTYQKALRSRNVLLKQDGGDELFQGWEEVMCQSAGQINKLRAGFIKRLQGVLAEILDSGGQNKAALEFYNGDNPTLDMESYLRQERRNDRRLGYTAYGPHKADVNFLLENRKISGKYSRGQVKRFTVALQLSTALTFEHLNGEFPVFLIDDFAAELDTEGRREVVSQLSDYQGQVFITATDLDRSLGELPGLTRFHVEQGLFNKVIE